MINSAKEAREMLKVTSASHGQLHREFSLGYLAALEGPAVKALVEGLEKIADTMNMRISNTANEIANDVLSQYREAVKK